MGAIRKRGNIWWIRYSRGGRRFEESSFSTRKEDASRLLKLREGDVAKGLPISPKIGQLRFDEAAADVETDYRINGKKSLDHVSRRIKKHLLPFFGGRRMAVITTSDARAFIDQRQQAGASAGEINRELAILKRAFNLALQAGKLLHKPHIPMLKEHNVRTGFFEREQFESVRAHLPVALRGVVTFAYLTGWRVPSEILTLEWRQVDREVGTVRLDPGATKNGEGRLFPYGLLLPELAAVIEARWQEREALKKRGVIVANVFHRNGKPISDFRRAWNTACEAAGCPGRLRHDFRRTAVPNLTRAGVPERVAMQLTGHKTRSVFDRYDIVNDSDLAEAVRKLAMSGGSSTSCGARG